MLDKGRVLERKLRRLELYRTASMKEAVVAYFARVRSGTLKSPRWAPEKYPTGSEKELYAEIAFAFLAAPEAMLKALLRDLSTTAAVELSHASLRGEWRAYRISTARPGARNRYRGPRIFCGGAGYGGIADIGLFLNPSFSPLSNPCLSADKILYFELKSSDGAYHDHAQLSNHLRSLERETATGVGYLAIIGGKAVDIKHPRLLGQVSIKELIARMTNVATVLGLGLLARELSGMQDRWR